MSNHFTTLEASPALQMSVAAPPAPVTLPPRRRITARRLLMAVAGVLALAGATDGGWHYWTVGRFNVSTDDAYIQADSTTVAPKISGYLAAVLVHDNESVKAGQILARIDDRDFRTALAQATADMQAAQAGVASRQASLVIQQSVIASARATVMLDMAAQTFAQQDDRRYATLVTTGDGSLQNAQQARSRISVATASVARDAASLASAESQIGLLQSQLEQTRAQLAHDVAARQQAALNLSYTTISAAVDGVAGNRTLRVGQYVQAGTQLMTLVPLANTYVVANFKETQLTDVRPGQPVDVEVDMFPGQIAHGHVDSLAPASGQEFALLPPDNATGNFTKIVQRIPVRIVLDQAGSLAGLLRPGMSVTPTIRTGPHTL